LVLLPTPQNATCLPSGERDGTGFESVWSGTLELQFHRNLTTSDTWRPSFMMPGVNPGEEVQEEDNEEKEYD
jgi:hypothetical protein